MSAKVTITYFGMEGQGKNITEAKRDAGARIEKVMQANYTPRVVGYGGEAYLIWQEPSPQGVRILSRRIMRDGILLTDHSSVGVRHCASENTDAVVLEYMLHVAECTWDEESDHHEYLNGHPELQKEFCSRVQFQKRHRDATRRGMNQYEAHYYAGNMLHLLRNDTNLSPAARAELDAPTQTLTEVNP